MADPILNSCTLGGLPCYDVESLRNPNLNIFFTHTGASRYGRGCFALTRKDYETLAKQQTAKLVMTGPPGPGLTIDVLIAGAEPLVTATGGGAVSGSQTSDLMRVIVVDKRRLMFGAFGNPDARTYNMMSQPFRYDTDANQPACYFQTLFSPATPWTWNQINNQLTDNGFPLMPSFPSWIPYNLVWNAVPIARACDDFFAKLYWVVGWDVVASKWTADTPGKMNPDNVKLYNTASTTAHLEGGIGERNLNATVNTYRVEFRAFNADNPSSPYAIPRNSTDNYSRSYTKDITVGGQAGAGIIQPLSCGEVIAIWQNGAWANKAQMDGIAADLAPRAYKYKTVQPESWEFAGIWPFSPDGQIRGVMWKSDSQGAKTVIRLNNDVDFLPMDDLRTRMEAWSNQLVVGLGAANVGFDSGNATRQVWQQPNYFWAKITDYAPLRETDPSPRYKYGYIEVQRNGIDWTVVAGGRTGTSACDYGECSGDPETNEHYCRWALSMYEFDNYQNAPVGPTNIAALVLMFVDWDYTNGRSRYTFLHAPTNKVGKIVAAGPCGEPDYDDARHWVQIEDETATGVNTQLSFSPTGQVPNSCKGGSCPELAPNIVTATDIANFADGGGSHEGVDEGDYVLLSGIYDNAGDGVLHYVFEGNATSLTNGLYCPQGHGTPQCTGALEPVFVDVDTDVEAVYYHRYFFDVTQQLNDDVKVCNPGTDLITFRGIAITGGIGDPVCHAQIIKFNQPSTGATFENKTPTEGTANQYSVFTGLSHELTPLPGGCPCTGDDNDYDQGNINQYVLINPADFALTAYGCTEDGSQGMLIGSGYNALQFDGGLTATQDAVNAGLLHVKVQIDPDSTDYLSISCAGIHFKPCSVATYFYRCVGGLSIGQSDAIQAGAGLDVTINTDCPDGIATIGIVIASDSTAYLTADCDGLHFIPSTSTVELIDCLGTSLGSFPSIKFIDGLTVMNVAGQATVGLDFTFTPYFTIGGSTTGITQNGRYDVTDPCNPVLVLNVDLPPNGLVVTDCAAGTLAGFFTTITGLVGVVLSGTAPSFSIGLSLTGGTYVTVTPSSCAYIIDVPPGTFDDYGSASAAQAAAQSYTDSAISTLSGMLPGMYDTLGAADAAETAAKSYTDTKLFANFIAYTPGAAGNWINPQPTTVQQALDRIAAAVAGLLGGGIP